MSIETVYDSEDQIPEISVKELFVKDEKTGKLALNGFKSESEVKKLEATVKATRSERDAIASKYKSLLNGKEEEDLLKELDELNLLRAEKTSFTEKASQSDEERNRKIHEMVELKTADFKRLNEKLKTSLEEKEKDLMGLNEWKKETLMSTVIAKSAKAAGVVDTALDDIIEIGKRALHLRDDGTIATKDNLMDAEEWVRSLENKSPHFFPRSQSGGATGSGRNTQTLQIKQGSVANLADIKNAIKNGSNIVTKR